MRGLAKLALHFLTVVGVVAVLLGVGRVAGVHIAGTVDTAQACNPCQCPNDLRNNCTGGEFYAIYIRISPNNICYIDAYRVDGPNTGRPVMRVNQSTLERFPAIPGQNTLIRQNEAIALYRLGSGELQINAGPDANNKVYYMIFDGCPATTITEGSYVNGQ